MPDQTRAILNSKKIHFIHGDISKSGFGINEKDMQTLSEEVTLVIHAAANIVLDADLRDSMRNNCLPSLELARIVVRFTRMKLLVQISTAYVNSFLPDGHVAEKVYNVSEEAEDPEAELAWIMDGKASPYAPRFASPYAYAKHLMERLLLKRHPLMPLLLLRPTIFGPALRDPYPLYGPENSTPLNKFAQFFLSDGGATQVWHATEGYTSGANILDETPVDFVANACLLHSAARTTGIVHVGAELFVRRTFDQITREICAIAPPDMRKDVPTMVFTEDRSVPQCILAELVQVGTRNWLFDCSRSHWLKQVSGPLTLEACRTEVDQLALARLQQVYDRKRMRRAKL